MVTTYALIIADEEITYTIAKKKNCKRIILKVLHGELLVTAPMTISDTEVNQFIHEKKDWITTHLLRQTRAEIKISQTKELFFRGVIYSVVFEYEKRKTIKIYEDITTQTLFFIVPFSTENEQVIKAYKEFMRREAQQLLKDRLAVLCQRDDVRAITASHLETARVRFLKTAYGLCYPNKSEIVLNVELINYDTQFMDYVILHEITHFLYQDHSKNFYHTFAKLAPNWKELKQTLNILHQQYGGWARK